MLIKSDPAPVQSRYAEQATVDLEENRREQRELTSRLEVLRQEEALLLDILSLAGRSALPTLDEYVPQQARGSSAPLPHGPSADAPAPAPKDTVSADGRMLSEATEQKSDTTSSDRKSGRAAVRQPLLGELLLDILKRHEEPRLAKELRDELLEAHPERRPTPQVVRNTLEALVAKGRIERRKQKRSVMYTMVKSNDYGTNEGAARAAISTE